MSEKISDELDIIGQSSKTETKEPKKQKKVIRKKKKKKSRARMIAARVCTFILTTVVLLVIALYGVMWILVNGPSTRAKNLFVTSVRETSAIGWFANIYLSKSEINEIINGNKVISSDEDTDTSLIDVDIDDKDDSDDTDKPDDKQDNQDKADEKDIEVLDITGPTYRGKLMIIKDPSRVMVGVKGEFDGTRGKTVADIVSSYGAVAGVNGGEFQDPGGMGHGEYPIGLVMSEGKHAYGELNTQYPLIIGLDKNNILRLDAMTGQEAIDAGIRDCVCFGAGPVLIKNGQTSEVVGSSSGLNPRTAIGQRADGAILLLVIDGRQASSLGATFEDLISIMLEHDAVNAANVDGGTSSNMVYNGEVITNCSSLYGTRQLPTAIIVK